MINRKGWIRNEDAKLHIPYNILRQVQNDRHEVEFQAA